MKDRTKEVRTIITDLIGIAAIGLAHALLFISPEISRLVNLTLTIDRAKVCIVCFTDFGKLNLFMVVRL